MSHQNIESQIKRIQVTLDESYDLLKGRLSGASNASSTVGEPGELNESPVADNLNEGTGASNICHTGPVTATFVDDVFQHVKDCIIQLDEEAGANLVFDFNDKAHRPTRNILKNTPVGKYYMIYKPTKLVNKVAGADLSAPGPKPSKYASSSPPVAVWEMEEKPPAPFVEVRFASEERGPEGDKKNKIVYSKTILPDTPAWGGRREEYQTVYVFGIKVSDAPFSKKANGNNPKELNDPDSAALAKAAEAERQRAAEAEANSAAVAAANAASKKEANNAAVAAKKAANNAAAAEARAANNAAAAEANAAKKAANNAAAAEANAAAKKAANNAAVAEANAVAKRAANNAAAAEAEAAAAAKKAANNAAASEAEAVAKKAANNAAAAAKKAANNAAASEAEAAAQKAANNAAAAAQKAANNAAAAAKKAANNAAEANAVAKKAANNAAAAAAQKAANNAAAAAKVPETGRQKMNRWTRLADGKGTPENMAIRNANKLKYGEQGTSQGASQGTGFVKTRAGEINSNVAKAAATRKASNNLMAARKAALGQPKVQAFGRESKAPGTNRVANSMRRNAERIRKARELNQAKGWWAPGKSRGGKVTRKLKRSNRTRKVKQLRRRQ